jgi:hypothetical protein
VPVDSGYLKHVVEVLDPVDGGKLVERRQVVREDGPDR